VLRRRRATVLRAARRRQRLAQELEQCRRAAPAR